VKLQECSYCILMCARVVYQRVRVPVILLSLLSLQCFDTGPRAVSDVVRIDPLRFLAGCRKRRL